MINSTGGLATNTHKKIWVAILTFLQKWHYACLQRAYTEAEVSHPIGYSPEFLPHPAQDRMSPHPIFQIRPLPLYLHPQIKMHLLGQLNTLHFCTIALAVHLAATNTIMCKTLKMTVHMGTIIPCQTSRYPKCHSGALQFFLLSFSWTSSLSAYL